jgi:MoaA/NifB/PqqE/SkfB family radical SAM enzyme
MTVQRIERISIELTNQCGKHCSFCYNHSHPQGATQWELDELVDFVSDCAQVGTKAVSFGGGEPLEYPELCTLLERLRGVVFRSFTTNGLLLDDDWFDRLTLAAPDKVHISIHFPDSQPEVTRVISQVEMLAARGINSGVNFLVSRSNLPAAIAAAATVRQAGISNERIVYLPMRGRDTPTPQQMAQVAGSQHFQSMTCLLECAKSPRFCSIGWDKQVGWCSYTSSRRELPTLTATGLATALTDLPLVFCGD